MFKKLRMMQILSLICPENVNREWDTRVEVRKC